MEVKPEPRPHHCAWVLLLALLLGLLGGFVGGFLSKEVKGSGPGMSGANEWRTSSTPAKSIQSKGGLPSSFADVAAALVPCVVNIDTVNETLSASEREKLRQLLPFPLPLPKEMQGIGSGVVIRSDGIVLTNEHVVKGAKKITVTLSTGEKYSGKLLGSDHELDVAVIKIDATNLPAASLGDSAALRPGDWAIAIGSPLGLTSSVTLGVVSALHRPIFVSGRPYANLVQTDASITPGNSGGPLVDAAGEVVGINTAIQIDTNSDVMGAAAARIGFAVPINAIKEVLDSLIKYGKAIRPWVGISMRMITPEDVKRWNLPVKEGIIIDSVIKDSPAAKAGLFRHDIIVQVDGRPVKDTEEVQEMVRARKVGDWVKLEVKRESAAGYWRPREISIKTAEMPAEVPLPQPEEK